MKKSVKLFCAAGLFIVMALSVSFQSFAYRNDDPKVTLNRSNSTLEEALIEINKQTGYSFSAKSELLRSAKPFDINVKDVALSYALDICFKNQPLTYVIKGYTIVIKEKAEETQKLDITYRESNYFCRETP